MPNILPLPDSFVGHCLVYVTIPQKCIKIDQELFFPVKSEQEWFY